MGSGEAAHKSLAVNLCSTVNITPINLSEVAEVNAVCGLWGKARPTDRVEEVGGANEHLVTVYAFDGELVTVTG